MLGGTFAIGIVVAIIARWLEPTLSWLENTLTYLSTGVIVFTMFYVFAEVIARYVFNSPLPGQLEGAELLVPIIVFFAASYTQARNGHVGMTLVVDSMPANFSRWMEVFTLIASVMICSILAYFGFKYSYQLYEYDDVTMSPPYWRTWPSAAAIVLGYGMLSIRMWLQALYLIAPSKFPAPPEDDGSELHASD